MEWNLWKSIRMRAGYKTAWVEFRNRGGDVSPISRAVIQP